AAHKKRAPRAPHCDVACETETKDPADLRIDFAATRKNSCTSLAYLSSEIAECRARQNGYQHETCCGPNQPAIPSLGSRFCIGGDVRNLRKHRYLNQFLQRLLVMNAIIQQFCPGCSRAT